MTFFYFDLETMPLTGGIDLNYLKTCSIRAINFSPMSYYHIAFNAYDTSTIEKEKHVLKILEQEIMDKNNVLQGSYILRFDIPIFLNRCNILLGRKYDYLEFIRERRMIDFEFVFAFIENKWKSSFKDDSLPKITQTEGWSFERLRDEYMKPETMLFQKKMLYYRRLIDFMLKANDQLLAPQR